MIPFSRKYLGCVRLCLVISFSTVASTVYSGQSSKNILLVCVDDLRSVMGCYGGAAKTPHIDQFAKSATVFTRHYVQWPVCGPSRSSMLGGLRPDSTGIYELGDSWKISKRPDTRPTLPKYFKDNGYKTLGYGKVYHGKGNGDGFGWSEPPWKLNWDCYVDFNYQPQGKKDKGWRPAIDIFDGPESRHNDYQTADKVIAALRANREGPFFIAGGFYKPHLPLVAPRSYHDIYTDEEIQWLTPFEIAKGAAVHMYAFSEISTYGLMDGEEIDGEASIDRKQSQRLTHAYYACVSFLDAQIGRVLAALEELNLSESTAVVIWSDHGFHLGDQGRWAKHTQFEQAMHSPLIVRLPGHQITTGQTEAIVESIDIYPTLCEFTGLPIPEFVEGASFVPVVKGESKGKEAAFSQIRPVNRKQQNLMAYSIRTKGFRYIEWREPDNENRIHSRELFDLRKHPVELENIADHPDYTEVIAEHAKLVAENYSSLQ